MWCLCSSNLGRQVFQARTQPLHIHIPCAGQNFPSLYTHKHYLIVDLVNLMGSGGYTIYANRGEMMLLLPNVGSASPWTEVLD